MQIVDTGSALREILKNSPAPRVLVPTMGAFHPGHLSLMHRAREIAGPGGTVVVSIFVNPIQFDRAADLDAYPRPMASDLAASGWAVISGGAFGIDKSAHLGALAAHGVTVAVLACGVEVLCSKQNASRRVCDVPEQGTRISANKVERLRRNAQVVLPRRGPFCR